MSKIGPFVAGGVIGAVAALLYAPRTGEQTRALVSEKVNAVWGEASDFAESAGVNPSAVYQTATERGASMFKDVAANAQEFAQDVQSKVQGIGGQAAAEPEVPVDNDDLREKIEAARERIAAQVVKNAEETEAQVIASVEGPRAASSAAAVAAEPAVYPAEIRVSDEDIAEAEKAE